MDNAVPAVILSSAVNDFICLFRLSAVIIIENGADPVILTTDISLPAYGICLNDFLRRPVVLCPLIGVAVRLLEFSCVSVDLHHSGNILLFQMTDLHSSPPSEKTAAISRLLLTFYSFAAAA